MLATFVHDVAQEWWVGYLHEKIMGSIPLIGMLWHKLFWSDLVRTSMWSWGRPNCSKSHRVADLCTSKQREFELHMGRLESFHERSLIRQFIWGLEGFSVKTVTLQYPKTIHAAIGHAEAIELAGLESRRPRGTSVPKGGA